MFPYFPGVPRCKSITFREHSSGPLSGDSGDKLRPPTICSFILENAGGGEDDGYQGDEAEVVPCQAAPRGDDDLFQRVGRSVGAGREDRRCKHTFPTYRYSIAPLFA